MRIRDPYDTGKSKYLGGELHEARRERDKLIDRLSDQIADPVQGEVRAGLELWEVERERRWKLYDFRQLDVALEVLRRRDVLAYHGVMAAFVYGWAPESSSSERGLVELDGLLPVPVRAPSVPVPRDAMIRRRAAEGWTSATIADTFGLSVSQVNRIVAAGEGS